VSRGLGRLRRAAPLPGFAGRSARPTNVPGPPSPEAHQAPRPIKSPDENATRRRPCSASPLRQPSPARALLTSAASALTRRARPSMCTFVLEIMDMSSAVGLRAAATLAAPQPASWMPTITAAAGGPRPSAP
jgi:hypothetical protein